MRTDDRFARTGLFVDRAPSFGYKVPGLVTWAIVAFCILGALWHPGTMLVIFTIFCTYVFIRMLFVVGYNFRGIRLCREWADGHWPQEAGVIGEDGLSVEDVHHVVLVPNYKESAELLGMTLEALAAQSMARERLTVVLAMEAKEPSAEEKARVLTERFDGSFANLLVSMHPANLPGEIACKGSNQAYAAIAAKRFLVDELGIPSRTITVTSCDADSILHPEYLAAVERMFVADPDRYDRFWQAPLFYYNNIWKVPATVRFMQYFMQALMLGDFANPFSNPLPISTYTLSLDLLEATGYWDPAIISEDWHIYLQAYFARGGNVKLDRVWLPTMADAPDGPTRWKALLNLYHQSVRHSWGAEDVGYILSQWPDAPEIKWWSKSLLLGHVLRDHLLRSVPWFIFMTGWALWSVFQRAGTLWLITPPILPIVLKVLWVGGAIAISVIFTLELRRNPPERASQVPVRALELFVSWLLMPVISLFFGAIPAVYAQSKLIFGRGLSWRVTPKRLAERLNEL
jgi:hypothetical protein